MDDERNDTTNAGTKKTPLTANERKRKHRANLTDEQKAVIRQKDAERKRLKRANLTDEQKAVIRQKDAERKRLKRASEKLTAKITDRRAADAARQAR